MSEESPQSPQAADAPLPIDSSRDVVDTSNANASKDLQTPSLLKNDVAAAAKALEEVASAGGQARLEYNANGGASLVIKVTNDNKDKILTAQNAIKTLTSNTTLKAANERDARLKRAYQDKRDNNMTKLMKAARDDKSGKDVKKQINGLKAGGEMLEKLLNEKEVEIKVDEDDEQIDGGDDGMGKEEKEKEASVKSDSVNTESTTKESTADTKEKRIANEIDARIAKGNKNYTKEGGFAAIHFACDSGNHEGLRFLLEAGADCNITERMGATPLHRVILGAGRYPMVRATAASAAAQSSGKKDDGSKMVHNTSALAGKNDNGDAFKSAITGVGKSNSAGVVAAGNGVGTIDTAYLTDYKACLKLLFDDNRFNLMANERREEECRDSPKLVATLDSMSINEKRSIGKNGMPKDDGFGISPVCLCVCQGYGGRDILYPLLEQLLTRGFDANASMYGVSALHIALRNAHYGCAFALTRAGANINVVHPDGKTALQAATLIYGESFARELREASVVAMAVADPTRRRDLLRNQRDAGAKKLAKRAMNAGGSFIKASRWREAAGAYSEAASYGTDVLSKRERFECLRNMSECFLHVERGLKSEEVARQLLKEFPKCPIAMIAVGEAMSHPSCGKLTSAQLKEVDKLADDALKVEKKSDGKEWWRTLEPTNRSHSSLIRALKLKGLVEGRSKEQNPAVKVANTALDEYFTPGGSIEKAAFAIELALKPELNHPSPLPLHGIRGFVYYSWASEIFRANSSCKSDRDRKDGLLRQMAPLKDKLSYKEARLKVQTAFEEFDYYAKNNINGEFPKLMYGFNIAKTSFALGKFDEGKRFALASIKERAEADLARLGDNEQSRRKLHPNEDDHFEGGNTQKLIVQLNWSLEMFRMLITQMVFDYVLNADSSSNATLPDILVNPMVENLSLKDDVINMPHLKLVLEKAVTYKLLDKQYEKQLLEKISGNPIKVNAAVTGLLAAMKTLEAGHQAMSDLRKEVGKIIINFVTGAHKMQKRDKSSSRVVGSLLMEALEWDKDVKIPKDLPKMYSKMATELRGG